MRHCYSCNKARRELKGLERKSPYTYRHVVKTRLKNHRPRLPIMEYERNPFLLDAWRVCICCGQHPSECPRSRLNHVPLKPQELEVTSLVLDKDWYLNKDQGLEQAHQAYEAMYEEMPEHFL